MIRAVLFDLDGTLIDTAPDMANCLNLLLAENNKPALTFDFIRPHVSNGSEALVKLGFGDTLYEAKLESLKQRYLDLYQNNIHIKSCLFAGMEDLLTDIEKSGLHWGIVTNKPSWLTEPLLKSMGLFDRSGCIISGDTSSERKPHPAPMYLACETIGVDAVDCIYIGDAQRDIEAGKNANMKTIIARYGYIGEWEDINSWGADAMIDRAEQIKQHYQ